MSDITGTYDPTTNTLTFDKDTVIVSTNGAATITIDLLSSPAIGTTLFAEPPVTWGKHGSPLGTQVIGSGTTMLTITESNNNFTATEERFPFTVHVSYSAFASKDPTIVNEGTGSLPEGISASLLQKAA